jgi:hypothetical protein
MEANVIQYSTDVYHSMENQWPKNGLQKLKYTWYLKFRLRHMMKPKHWKHNQFIINEMTHITKIYPHLTKLSTLMIKTISRNGIGKSDYLRIQILNLVVYLKTVVNTQRNRWISHQSNAEIQNKAWVNKNYFLKLGHPSRNSFSQSFLEQTFTLLRFFWWKDCE